VITGSLSLPNGLDEIREELPVFLQLIERTARWVNPDSFRSLPVWYPECARGSQRYLADWKTIRRNSIRNVDVKEANIKAGTALRGAIGAKKAPNWTVCHIWGTDDPKFQKRNDVIQDPRYYSCVGNMVLLPTPLKAFTDSIPEVKFALRVCAFYTYGWICEHDSVDKDAKLIKGGLIPDEYPRTWPRRIVDAPPLGTAPYSDRVKTAIARRKQALRTSLSHRDLPYLPRESILDVLKFWRVSL
jgi:hypothetical protein